jgi:hypothetical protein
MILAECTAEIAISKKNGSRSSPTNKGRFLSKMRKYAGNTNLITGLTNPLFSFQAIYPAFMGTKGAAIQDTKKFIYSFFDQAALIIVYIGRNAYLHRTI